MSICRRLVFRQVHSYWYLSPFWGPQEYYRGTLSNLKPKIWPWEPFLSPKSVFLVILAFFKDLSINLHVQKLAFFNFFFIQKTLLTWGENWAFWAKNVTSLTRGKNWALRCLDEKKGFFSLLYDFQFKFHQAKRAVLNICTFGFCCFWVKNHVGVLSIQCAWKCSICGSCDVGMGL